MAELVDALDSKSSSSECGFESHSRYFRVIFEEDFGGCFWGVGDFAGDFAVCLGDFAGWSDWFVPEVMDGGVIFLPGDEDYD